jgi:agmatinase
MTHFDPNAASTEDSGIFGLPFKEEESALIYLPVPWEATTSYGGGTSHGPEAILNASRQVDLFDTDVLKPYEPGLFIIPESEKIRALSEVAQLHAKNIIDAAGRLEGESKEKELLRADLKLVNDWGQEINEYVYAETKRVLAAKKLIGIIGGDHSVPFGALQAAGEIYPEFGLLHFDAHSDTRSAYEGFKWSHASIMYNVLENIPQVKKLVQVGIRDVSEEETNYIEEKKDRVSVFYDRYLSTQKFEGRTWQKICLEIIEKLPQLVWVTFDIDGLDPKYCPHTGTPVPGGLEFQEANYLLRMLVQSGRKIIGFDLNEVSPDLSENGSEWDANVGARLLYKLTGWTLASQGLARVL